MGSLPVQIGDSAAGQYADRAAAVQAYCREARRLRYRLSSNPVRMHKALRQLSLSPAPVRESPGDTWCAEDPADQFSQSIDMLPLRCPWPLARAFAADVAREMDGPVLRYSSRMSLLRQAQRMGIERFEANLIIAAVQHQARWLVDSRPAPGNPWRLMILAAVFVQAIILWSAWQVLGL